MSKPKLVQRACCGSGVSRRRGQIAPTNVEVSFDIAGVNGPIISEIEDHQIDRSTCTHEAAHAVFAHGFSLRIASASAKPPAQVIYSTPCALSPVERVAVLWSGPAAEAAANRCRITLGVDDESDYLTRVRAFEFGGCDECKMALTAWTANGLDAGIEAARAVFREGQLLALKLLDRRDVRTAITALADKLSEGEIVDGATCHELLEHHLMFGSLQLQEPPE
jgi:hypothetical protein